MELNLEEIELIKVDARYSYFNFPGFISRFTKNRLDILSITPINKLIFIQGDLETGFKHIKYRHSYFSLPKIEPNNRGKNKYILPTKFSKNSNPLLDYIRIADKLYIKGVINNNRNKNLIKYDTFYCKLEDELNKEYLLILYKDTKIIHTLYPIEKGKSELPYTKALLQVVSDNIIRLSFYIPYIDISGNIKYSLHIDIDASTNTENIKIIIFENDRPKEYIQVINRQIIIQHYRDMINRMREYEYANLSKFEDIIKMYEKGQIAE
jgi:hypothetical protein